MKTQKSFTILMAVAIAMLALSNILTSSIVLAAPPAAGTTTVAFSPNPATLVSGTDVTIMTTTTSTANPDGGTIQIQIATDGSGNPVDCSFASPTWVRIDGGGSGLTVSGGTTSLAVDLDNLSSLGLGLSDVACGNSVCFRAHYITCGPCTNRVAEHFSDPAELATQCPAEEGCSLGFWKENAEMHDASAWPSGYSPSDPVSTYFTIPDCLSSCSLGSATLLDALNFAGGPELCDKARLLLKQAVAALLNSATACISYPRSTADVESDVNTALASCDGDTILALKTALDADNNLGCPLSQSSGCP